LLITLTRRYIMKRRITFASALVAVLLAMFSLQAEAFFCGFGGGFSFGGGGWGYPSYYGWHNPYYYGYRHYGYAPYRHYAYNWAPYRPYIFAPAVADAPEPVAEK
jgi:hypothetical protein